MNDIDYTANTKRSVHCYIDVLKALRNTMHKDHFNIARIDALMDALIDDLECYANRLSNAHDDDSPSAMPHLFAERARIAPPPEDIAVGRACVDRIMKYSSRPDSLLTDSEAWNLLFLFEVAYPSDAEYITHAEFDSLDSLDEEP